MTGSDRIERDTDDRLWSAVADPMRRRLLDLLLASGPATATGLAAQTTVTRQAVAKHLAVLEGAGLVTSARSGRELHWQVVPAGVDAASRSMARAAAAWDQRLAAIKRIAECDDTTRED